MRNRIAGEIVVAHGISIAALLILSLQSVLGEEGIKRGEWSLVHPGNLAAGLSNDAVPTRRYGAGLAAVGDAHLVLLNGYMYDHPRSQPTWMCDMWLFDAVKGTWSRRQGKGSAPRPSYKQAVAASGALLFAFGGDDGGHSVGATSHVWGSYTAALHVLDVTSWTWFSPKQIGERPQARQGASLVAMPVGGNTDAEVVVLFGGMGARSGRNGEGNLGLFELNDVHVLDVGVLRGNATDREKPLVASWQRLGVESGKRPNPRRAHGAVAINSDTMCIVAGFSSNEQFKNMNDVWCLSLSTRKWRCLSPQQASATEAAPTPRGGVAVAFSSHHQALILHGGANCKIACTCLSDLWVFSLSTESWRRVSTKGSQVPIARHFHSFSQLGDTLFVFGGESYSPYAYWNDMWRMDLAPGRSPAQRLARGSSASTIGYFEGMTGMAKNLMIPTEDSRGAAQCAGGAPDGSNPASLFPILPSVKGLHSDHVEEGPSDSWPASVRRQVVSGEGLFSLTHLLQIVIVLVTLVIFWAVRSSRRQRNSLPLNNNKRKDRQHPRPMTPSAVTALTSEGPLGVSNVAASPNRLLRRVPVAKREESPQRPSDLSDSFGRVPSHLLQLEDGSAETAGQ